MTPLGNRFSRRTIRIIYTCAAIVVLGICAANLILILFVNTISNDQCRWTDRPGDLPGLLVTDVVPNGVTDRAGVKNGDILLAIDGRQFGGDTAAKAQNYLNTIAAGDTATYLLERDGRQLTAKVQILKLFNFIAVAFFLLGLGFLIVGYIVVMTKPEGYLQRLFGRYGLFAMLLYGLFVLGTDGTAPAGWQLALIVPFYIARILAPPTFVLFFLNFPLRREIAGRRWLHVALYGGAFLLTLAAFIGIRLRVPGPFVLVMTIILHSFFVAGLVIFTVTYFARLSRQQRKELRHILAATGVGALTLAYTFIIVAADPLILFLRPALMLPVLLLIFVPGGFGYAIFRYRLMDIDLIIKRSLIYGAVTALLAVIYLVVVFGIGSVLSAVAGQSENRIVSVVGFIAIALLFDPVKRRVQESIDRTFYRERRNYQQALLEFSQELPRKMNLPEILDSIVARISSTMHVEKVAVVLCDPIEGCTSVARNIDVSCCQFTDVSNGLVGILRTQKVPQSLAFIGEETNHLRLNPGDRSNIVRSGIVLAVPMFIQDRLIGMINVGPKLSGRFYSQEDIDLLATVAGQAAIAIENARLHRSEIEKQKIEEELNLARRIQQSLLPKDDPAIDGLDISGISLPALTVGGDYFDYIRLGPRRILVVVADVSGKGMSAALYMSKVQGMIQVAAHMYDSPKEMLIHVNRRLYEGIERRSFITMILALFDLDRREVRMCRAGHTRAILGTNGTLEQLQSTGIGLGLEPGPVFEGHLEELCYPLRTGQLYFFYSDGLTEATNAGEEMFGEEETVRLLAAQRHRPAREIQASLVDAVRAFQGAEEQHDDVTIVVVKAS